MAIQPRGFKPKQPSPEAADGEVRNRMIRLRDGDDRTHERLMAILYPKEPAPPPSFKVGDIVQFKSGGHAMVVEDCECCGCYALIYSRKGVVEQLDVPGPCLQLYEPAADRGGDGPDIPF